MASNEEFDKIVAGQFTPKELEISYHGIELQRLLELASQDPAILESVKEHLSKPGNDKYQADIVLIGQEICQRYALPPEYFAMAWNTCKTRLEREGFPSIDAPADDQEQSAANLNDARKLIKSIVLPYVERGQQESLVGIYLKARDICHKHGIEISFNEVRYTVDSLIPEIEAARKDASAED